MLRRVAPVLLAACCGCFASSALAQDAPPIPDSNGIIVQGKTSKQKQKEVQDFVSALPRTGYNQPLSRFEDRICPVAFGLSPEQNAAVAARIGRVGEAVGLKQDQPGCTANILLIVTADKNALLDNLARKKPEYFFPLSPSDIRRLQKTPGPAVAWQQKGPVRNADGVSMQQNSDGIYVNRTVATGSRITASGRIPFAASVVVVEWSALEGFTTTQLADYAAVRALAGIDPARLDDSQAPTIVKILAAPMGSEVPASLTKWDLGLLRGLYSVDPNLYASSQRGSIERSVGKEIGKP